MDFLFCSIYTHGIINEVYNYFIMANFKTHISWGVICATMLIVGVLIYFAFEPRYLMAVFFAVLVGSFLPDIDLDEGVPFQIIFGLLSVGIAGFSIYILYMYDIRDHIFYFAVPITVFIFVRFVLGEIFMRFTHHRGIWHSIPAAVLVGLMTAYVLNVIHVLERQEMSTYIGAAVVIGYIIHLILDEIYATVNLSGQSLLPKRSFGSALKLWAPSKTSTLLVYGSIIVLCII